MDSAGNILDEDLTYVTAGYVLTKIFPESNQRGELDKTFQQVSLKTTEQVTDFVTALELANTNPEQAVGTPTEEWRMCLRLLDGISNPDTSGTPWSLEAKIKETSIDGRQCGEWSKEEILHQLDIGSWAKFIMTASLGKTTTSGVGSFLILESRLVS